MPRTSNDQPDPATLGPLVISAPFGNYIQPPGTTPTLGTFTAARRGGRVRQTVRTVRFYPKLGAWVNRIGLRNPGIAWLVNKVESGKIDVSKKIVSIHGFTAEDWTTLLEQAKRIDPLAVELNMSCPNVGQVDWPDALFGQALATGVPVIVKLPPIHYQQMVDHAFEAGITTFHCCNTLPVPAGGMSGRPLMALSLAVIGELRRRLGDRPRIIGGGGITHPDDLDTYRQAGANHFAIGTKTFNPRLLWTTKPLQPMIDRAGQLSESPYSGEGGGPRQ